MASITAATTHQIKPFSFSTGKWPRYEFWRTYLQSISFAGLLAFTFTVQFKARRPPIDSKTPWIFILMGLAQITVFLWKLRSSSLYRHQADRTFANLSPQLKQQIKTRNRPLWERLSAESLFTILIGVGAWFLFSSLAKDRIELQIHWWILGTVSFIGILLLTLLQIRVDLQRIGRTPPEEFIFYDIGLVWANRRPGLGHAPENEFFPWSSIAAIVWREPTQWLPQTLAIRGTDPLWDRWIKFRNLSDEDRDNLLNNLAQYVPINRE